MHEIKIGITMRVTEAQGYTEVRSSIAHDWFKFMEENFPHTNWLCLPNIGKLIQEYISVWGINTIVLSGGDDIGLYPIRDETEVALLEVAEKKEIKVLGVCRGLQIIHNWLGGDVVRMGAEFENKHKNTRHSLLYNNTLYEVNSYHSCALKGDTAAETVCIADDDSVEAIIYKNMLGLMWHPEREKILPQWQKELITNFLYN
jgi:putative glutamine amidotransferase